MTMSIEYPPDTKACARCNKPLAWLYSARTGKWVSFATEPTDIHLLRVHDCPQYPDDRPPPAWRDVVEQPAAVIHAGAERVRQVLATRDQQGGET